MIAHVPASSMADQTPAWHSGFLQLLPEIRRHAQIRFRMIAASLREEAVQEVIASSLIAYVRLVELGKEDVAYAGPLARYGVAQFRAGRRVGCQLNSNDVTSDRCRVRKGVTVGSLDRPSFASEGWRESLVEDRHANPADIAAIRIDFCDWLKTLSPRNRRVALRLAEGETTSGAARAFCLTRSRISQLRAELNSTWRSFQGESTQTSRK